MYGRFGAKLMKVAFVASLSLVLAPVANASLIGDQFGCDNTFSFSLFSTVCTATNVLIGEGVEVSTQNFQVDIDDTSITLTHRGLTGDIGFSSFQPNTIEFTSLDWVDVPTAVITGFILQTDVTGFTASDVTTSDHGVTLFVNETWGAGDFIKVTLETSREVPTPSTLALFAIGLVGLGVLSRRGKKSDA